MRSSISFTLQGPGEIVATDNGDPTDMTPFVAHQRKAINGLCLVIVRSVRGEPGQTQLTVQSQGLESTTIELRSVAAPSG